MYERDKTKWGHGYLTYSPLNYFMSSHQSLSLSHLFVMLTGQTRWHNIDHFLVHMKTLYKSLQIFSNEWKITDQLRMLISEDYERKRLWPIPRFLNDWEKPQRTCDTTSDKQNCQLLTPDIQSILMSLKLWKELTVHSFWKAAASLMSVSTLATVSPISVISHATFKWLSKLLWNKQTVKLNRQSEYTIYLIKYWG